MNKSISRIPTAVCVHVICGSLQKCFYNSGTRKLFIQKVPLDNIDSFLNDYEKYKECTMYINACSMFVQSNYYPGDYYDYYAVTKSPWDSGLESMR